MRRKSERTASKKTKSTPEKKEKVEKVKHTRTRRRKPSSSSASESTEEPPPIVEVAKIVETKATEPKSAKEDNSNESEDQVWQVKSTESSGDVGEIQKLKLCLARPPSTPERVDRSPRSKRKHPRATSSSDGQSVEGEDKKKSRHRSKRHSESQEVEKTDDRGDKTNLEVKDASPSKPLEAETNQSCKQKSSTTDETPVSTTTDEIKCDKVDPNETEKTEEKPEEEKSTETEASKDTEVQEAQEAQEVAAETEAVTTSPKPDTDKEQKENIILPIGESPVRKRSLSAEKSEILELHAEESQCETSEVSFSESQEAKSKTTLDEDKDVSNFNPSEVSINKSTTEISGQPGSNSEDIITPNNIKDKIYPITTEDKISSINSEDSIMSDKSQDKLSPEKSQDKLTHDKSQDKLTPDNSKDKVIPENSKEKVTLDKSRDIVSVENSEEKVTPNNAEDKNLTEKNDIEHDKSKEPEKESTAIPDSTQNDAAKDTVTEFLNNKEYSQTTPDIPNGEVTPLVVNRKRRWGSRPSKLSSQKSITISTDVLKEIMPDVKPVEFDEVIEEKKHKRIGVPEKIDRPILPKIIIENTEVVEISKKEKQIEGKVSENVKLKDSNLGSARKISIVKDNDSIIARPPSPPKHKQSSILFITNLVRPFTLPQLKNLLQRTGRIVDNGFWIDRIKSKCYVKYDTEDQAVETRHALHGVTWPVSNPKTLHVDFATEEDLDKAKANEESDNAKVSTIPGTVEDWLREQDMKREKGELDKPWERKAAMREWDVGKNDKTKEAIRPDKNHRDERPPEKKRHRTIERSPEPARKFKKKEEEAPAKLLDDLFRKTKTTPCIYWLPLSAETIAVKEEQRRQHMAEHERRLQELRRTHRRH